MIINNNCCIYDSDKGIIGFNIKGEPVARNRSQFPYSYEPYCVYRNDWNETDTVLYSDRMKEWSLEKFECSYNNVWPTNVSQYFHNKDPKDIEKFIAIYLGKKIVLTGIEEACNFSTGYPYWVFYYRKK